MLLRIALLFTFLNYSLMASGELFPESWSVNTHTGLITGSVGGSSASAASFVVMPAMAVNLEIPRGVVESHVFSMVLASDLATAQTKYFFAGYGHKYYFYSWGRGISAFADGLSLESRSPVSYYLSWRAGLASMQGKEISASLVFNSTGINIGGNIGLKYALTRSLGINAEFGLDYAYGFSTVAISGLIISIISGLTYNF